MEKRQKLTKVALAALVLAATMPHTGLTADVNEVKEVYLAHGGCGGDGKCGGTPLKQTAPGDGYYHPTAMNTDSKGKSLSVPPAGDTTGTSSYQGTSTGPGPNDGYPGSPKGSYKTETGGSSSH